MLLIFTELIHKTQMLQTSFLKGMNGTLLHLTAFKDCITGGKYSRLLFSYISWRVSLSSKGQTYNTRKGHCSLLASVNQTGKGKHHWQIPIWQTKYCDRACSHRKQGDATSLLSGFKICSAALHTLFSIELAVQNRFNQLMWHCCRLAVKWNY